MHPSDIAALATALSAPDSPNVLPLTHLAGNLYLSRTVNGEPSLVVTYSNHLRLPAGRQTEGLVLAFHEQFAVTLDDESFTCRCGLLRCTAVDLAYHFYLMVQGLLDRQTTNPRLTEMPSTLLAYVEEWQSLLLGRRSLTVAEEIGLWGELWFIVSSEDADGAVAAWKGPLRKMHDFAANGIDLDIKTSLRGHRHHFRLEQLTPSPSDSRRFICSVSAVDDPAGGSTVDNLVNQVRERLRDPGPFERLLLEAHYDGRAEHATRLSALDTIMVTVSAIPKVIADPGVSEVEFVSDLSHCAPLPSDLFLDTILTLTGVTGGR